MEKRKDIRNIYVDEEFLPVWEKMKKIADREGTSISQKIRELVVAYVAAHDSGNPQQRLDVICERGEAYRAPKLCLVCGSAAEAEALFLSGLRGYVCGGCLARKREQGLVRRVLRKL